jgi:hypothetical protein
VSNEARSSKGGIRARFHKGGFHALFRLGPTESGVDAVLFGTRDHIVICMTAIVDGRREIVGLEVQPAPVGFDLNNWIADPGALRLRAEEALVAYEELVEGRTPRPVSAALLRGIPLTNVLAYREADVGHRIWMDGVYAERGMPRLSPNDISAHDEARLAYLDDALMYVAALKQRAQPAEAIAMERGISKRTAEGRIAKARALGLLTKASGRTASGELTEEGARLDRWRRSLSEEGKANG